MAETKEHILKNLEEFQRQLDQCQDTAKALELQKGLTDYLISVLENEKFLKDVLFESFNK